MLRNRRALLPVTGIIGVLLVVPGVAAGVAALGGESPTVGTPGSRIDRARAVPSAVAAKLGVFRTAQHPDDRPTVGRPSRAFTPDIDVAYAESTGMNLDLARLVHRGKRIFAIPGSDVLCLVNAGGSAACLPDATIGRAFGTQSCGADLPSGVVSVSGLVADSVSSVSVRKRDGSSVPVAVQSNFAYIELEVSGDAQLPIAVDLVQGGKATSAPVTTVAMSDLQCADRE